MPSKNAPLGYTPERTPKSQYAVDSSGIVTVKVPAKLFREERRVPLDEAGSFLWLHIDGKRTVKDLCKLFAAEYPKVKDPVPKVVKFLSTLRRDGLIAY